MNTVKIQKADKNTAELYASEPIAPKLKKMIAHTERDISAGRVSKKFTNARDFLADLKS